MASYTEVKHYLAHWFQLGKQVMSDSGQVTLQPEKVIQGDRFSPEFEACWAKILEKGSESFYLSGTDQTVAELLSPKWEVVSCARCNMPVPMPQADFTPHPCPCEDLSNWPNEEIPRPRLPINSYRHLGRMNERLRAHSSSD
ncbi:MAG: hypothetical protein WBB01_12005 [Phormidesmis sp.]